jgi:hypothetical protein
MLFIHCCFKVQCQISFKFSLVLKSLRKLKCFQETASGDCNRPRTLSVCVCVRARARQWSVKWSHESWALTTWQYSLPFKKWKVQSRAHEEPPLDDILRKRNSHNSHTQYHLILYCSILLHSSLNCDQFVLRANTCQFSNSGFKNWQLFARKTMNLSQLI